FFSPALASPRARALRLPFWVSWDSATTPHLPKRVLHRAVCSRLTSHRVGPQSPCRTSSSVALWTKSSFVASMNNDCSYCCTSHSGVTLRKSPHKRLQLAEMQDISFIYSDALYCSGIPR